MSQTALPAKVYYAGGAGRRYAASRLRSMLLTTSIRTLSGRTIATGNHCFGYTAGSGSSCGGALT